MSFELLSLYHEQVTKIKTRIWSISQRLPADQISFEIGKVITNSLSQTTHEKLMAD